MTGENRRMRDTGEPMPLAEEAARTSAQLSSRELLKAQLSSGQHCIQGVDNICAALELCR